VRKSIETARPLEEARTVEPPGAVVGSLDIFFSLGKMEWKGKGWGR